MNKFLNLFKNDKKFLGELNKYSKLGLIFLVIVSLASWIYFKAYPKTADKLTELFLELIGKGILDGENISGYKLFLNNLRACALIVTLGLIPFIFYPVLAIFQNGIIIGAVAVSSAKKINMTIVTFLAGILPHGIFEIPAILISFAMGIILCKNISKLLLRKDHISFKILFINNIKTFIFIVIPLLVVAAIIETNITPIILKSFIK